MATGRTTNNEIYEFLKAKDRVPMLFNQEIQKYIERIYRTVCEHATDCSMEDHVKGDEHSKLLQRKYDRFREIIAFFDEFPILIADHVQMHTRVPS